MSGTTQRSVSLSPPPSSPSPPLPGGGLGGLGGGSPYKVHLSSPPAVALAAPNARTPGRGASPPLAISIDPPDDRRSASPGSPEPSSPLLPPSAQKSSALLRRLALACASDDDVDGRRRLCHLLSNYAASGQLLNAADGAEDNDGGGGVGLTPLMLAALSGNVDCCRELLAAGALPTLCVPPLGWSALHFAAAMGKSRCAAVVAAAAGPSDGHDLYDSSGFTPLHVAAMRGYTPVIDVLVREGHDVNAVSAMQATALHLAAQEGRLFTVKRLVHLRADLHREDAAGAIPLTVSARAGHANIAKVLIEAGSDVNHATRRGVTCLAVACEHGQHNFARTLLQSGAVVDPIDVKTAAAGGFPAVLQELLPFVVVEPESCKIARRNTVRGGGLERRRGVHGSPVPASKPRMVLGPALHAAARQGRTECVRLLLDHGAEVDSLAAGNNGLLPLHTAIRNDAPVPTIEALLQAGADPAAPARTRNAASPLIMAVERRRIDLVKAILDGSPTRPAPSRKAAAKCLGTRDAAGNTVLHVAARIGDTDMMRYLFAFGARHTSGATRHPVAKLARVKSSAAQETPLLLSAREGHAGCVAFLLQQAAGRKTVEAHDRNRHTPLLVACSGGHDAVVAQLVRQGNANVNAADNIGATPLHAACELGSVETAMLLLSSGASPDAVKLSGGTVLMSGVRHGHAAVVARVLKRLSCLGAGRKRLRRDQMVQMRREAVNAVMRRCGSSALLLAAKQGKRAAAALLCDNRYCDKELRNADGDTALCLAVLRGDVKMVKTLVRRGCDPRAVCCGGATPRSHARRLWFNTDMCKTLTLPADLVGAGDDDREAGSEEEAEDVGGAYDEADGGEDGDGGGGARPAGTQEAAGAASGNGPQRMPQGSGAGQAAAAGKVPGMRAPGPGPGAAGCVIL